MGSKVVIIVVCRGVYIVGIKMEVEGSILKIVTVGSRNQYHKRVLRQQESLNAQGVDGH